MVVWSWRRHIFPPSLPVQLGRNSSLSLPISLQSLTWQPSLVAASSQPKSPPSSMPSAARSPNLTPCLAPCEVRPSRTIILPKADSMMGENFKLQTSFDIFCMEGQKVVIELYIYYNNYNYYNKYIIIKHRKLIPSSHYHPSFKRKKVK